MQNSFSQSEAAALLLQDKTRHTASPVTAEAAALLAQIENHCTVECCESPYSPWARAAIDAAADLWALRKGWPPELVRATYKAGAGTPSETVVEWNATKGMLRHESLV